jgi:aminoglycoside phosphotransferase (APT) family kinase protein
VPYPALSAEDARAALLKAGVDIAPDALSTLQIEARDERWAVRLPGDRIAWFAASDAGLAMLRLERRVLGLLAQRCSFAVPRILWEGADGDVDLRALVPGRVDPWGAYQRVAADPALAGALGGALGALLAEQHTRVTAADAAGWLPALPTWPEPAALLEPRLRRVVEDGALLSRVLAVIERYEAVSVAEADRALVHTDLGLHNLALDDTLGLRGVFDYEGAAWADRHHDLRYLVFDNDRDELLEAACAAYEPATGRPVDRARVLLYNAACAVGFLAYRAALSEVVPAEARSCGRTLAEDLRWTRHALARCGG